MLTVSKTLLLFLLQLFPRTTTITTDIETAIARTLPMADIALDAVPILTVHCEMKIHCLRECMRYNCLSFNFGTNICEMFDTYVCQDIGTLRSRAGFRHYDVVNGSLMQFVDSYTHLTDCTLHGRCSPKCYQSTTIVTTPTTATPTSTTSTGTTTVAPTTVNPFTTPTVAPTTTSLPATTTTSVAPTTSTPATTTTIVVATTTTTVAPTTSTTTAVPTTTTTTVTTTTMDESSEDVTTACSTNAECIVSNSNCRNGATCECIAGYSYYHTDRACVTNQSTTIVTTPTTATPTSTTSTGTTTVAPTTVNPFTTPTVAPTTTSLPATTTTSVAPTTSTPATTTTIVVATTTTTVAPTTSTTTAVPTTTTTTVTTTTMDESSEDVTTACSTNAECIVSNSNCRNGATCECIAGYSYYHTDRACVTTCPYGHDNTFHKTMGFYLFSLDMMIYSTTTRTNCMNHCIDNGNCLSYEFDSLLNACTLSSVTKYGNSGFWFSDPFYEYYQRNCA